LDTLSPTRGPSGGGSLVTIRGSTFRAGRSFFCAFDAYEVPATFVSPEAITCRAPGGSGTSRVAVSQNGGADFDGALQFGYFSTPRPDALQPARGLEAAGAVVSVRGTFPADEAVLCRFGDDVVEGSVLTKDEVRCPAPAQTVQRDVQEIVFDSIAAVQETQTIDVVGRKTRREVQEVRVTASGGARREDFVDLDVSLNSATPAVQTLTSSLDGHARETQRVSIGLPSHRREVQRLDFTDLRRAYLKDGNMNCRETNFTADRPEQMLKPCAAEFPSYVHDYSYKLVFGPYATKSLPADGYQAWFLKEALEALVPFRDGVDVQQESSQTWLVTFPYTAGDVPAPRTESSNALEFLDGSNASMIVQEIARGIAPPTYRLEIEGAQSGGYRLEVLGTETVVIPFDASANEVSAAVNAVLDSELYGWAEVRERAAAYGNHAGVRAWDAYDGHRGRAYDISFVDACRGAFAGTVLSVSVNQLASDMETAVRVTESSQGVETLSGTYQVSTDGGGTYSDHVRVDGGKADLLTAIKAALSSESADVDPTATIVSDPLGTLRGCGFVYDVELPAGRDFPPLQTNASAFESPEAYLRVNTTADGSQYEAWNVALEGASGTFFLSYGHRETADLSVGITITDLEAALLADLKLTTTVTSATANDYHVTFTDALAGGGLAQPLRLGGFASRFGDNSKTTLAASSANCTRVRPGRWNPLSGFNEIALVGNEDTFVTVPFDATAQELERLFASRADVFGRPAVSRIMTDHLTQSYEWSVTFADYAGAMPLLVRVGGTTETYGKASLTQATTTAAAGSDCCLRGNVSVLLDDGEEQHWLRDVPASVTERELQDYVDVAFGDASYLSNATTKPHNVSATRTLPYAPSFHARVERRISGASTWRFSRVRSSPHGGWGNASVVKDVAGGALALGTVL
jgi:hypothetical protein